MSFQDIIRRVLPARFRPIGYLSELAKQRSGLRVQAGPFQGMRYTQDSIGSAYIPKLLGIYERELTPCVDQLCKACPDLVVDVGAAEGYYAIGLARRIPNAQVIAFEMEERGRDSLHEMGALNGVGHRVDIRGRCKPNDLADAMNGLASVAVVCDVEGYEQALLSPDVVPQLRSASILVELHDFIVPGITEQLEARFADSHSIEHIWQEARSPSEFPWQTLVTRVLPARYLEWAVSEWRPVRMAWLWMTPKSL